MKDEAAARTVITKRILGEARREPVVQRQHLVTLGQLPPGLDHGLQTLRFGGREIAGLGKIAVLGG